MGKLRRLLAVSLGVTILAVLQPFPPQTMAQDCRGNFANTSQFSQWHSNQPHYWPQEQSGPHYQPWAPLSFGLAGGLEGGLLGLGIGAALGSNPVGWAIGLGIVGAGLAGIGAATAGGCPAPPCLTCNLQPPGPPIYAPDIYLYPTHAETVHVTLGGLVTASRPAYGDGWTVRAMPSGRLASGAGHLLYEAAASVAWQTARGWVVKASAWPAWIRSELPRLGLNARETGDFARDWAANLPPAPYYLVAPQPAALVDAAVELQVRPAPQTVYRLWLYVVPLQAPVRVARPSVPPLRRRGFTVVEWGVVFPAGVSPVCAPEVGACP